MTLRQRSSSLVYPGDLYDRLLRGDATPAEYVEALRRDARANVEAFRRKHTTYDKSTSV